MSSKRNYSTVGFISVLIAALVGRGCEPPPAPPPEFVTISGRVYLHHGEVFTPLQGATVFTSADLYMTNSSITDSSGFFQISEVHRSAETLIVHHNIFGRKATVIELTGATNIDFTYEVIPFEYPLALGTVSKYKYIFLASGGGYIRRSTSRRGDHFWTVSDSSILGQDTIYLCSVVERDSVRVVDSTPDSVYADHSYIETRTSEFHITVGPSEIYSAWPSRMSYTDSALHVVPRYYSESIGDSVNIIASYARAVYQDRVGLRSFYMEVGSINITREWFVLAELGN